MKEIIIYMIYEGSLYRIIASSGNLLIEQII